MLPLFAGTTGRDSKRHQPLPVVARRLCPYHSCRVPFARNSPFGCFAQKVPDTYVSLIANEMSWRLAPPYLGSAGRSQRCSAFPGGSLGTRGIGNAANTVAIAKTANPTWRCPAIVDQAAQVGALQLLSKEQLENKVVHRC